MKTPPQHRTIFVQHRIVAVLEQRARVHGHLIARHPTTAHRAADRPEDAAVAVVGAAVAVFLEGAAELADDDHHRRIPGIAGLLGEGGQALPELAEPVGEIAGAVALADVRVPATDVDEAETVALAHQPADAPRLAFEALGGDGIAVGGDHLAGQRLGRVGAHLEAFADGTSEARVLVHRRDDVGLPIVDPRLAHVDEREVGHLHAAAKAERQLVGEGDRVARAEHAGEPVHEARLVVAVALQRLAELDRILRLEVAPRGVVGAGEGHERGLLLREEGKHRIAQRGVEAPVGIERQRRIGGGARAGDRDVRALLVVEAARGRHEQAGGVVAAAQEDDQHARRRIGRGDQGGTASGEREDRAGGDRTANEFSALHEGSPSRCSAQHEFRG